MDCIILWKRPFTIYVINNYLWINDCEYMKIIYVNWDKDMNMKAIFAVN